MSEDPDDRPSWEVEEILRRRRGEALEAGLSLREANLYAQSGASSSELRRLVRLGCPRELIARVLL